MLTVSDILFKNMKSINIADQGQENILKQDWICSKLAENH